MQQWTEVGKTVLRVFVSVTLAQVVLDLFNLMNFHWADWKPIIVSGAAAAIGVIIVALNPKDTRYGLGASTEA